VVSSSQQHVSQPESQSQQLSQPESQSQQLSQLSQLLHEAAPTDTENAVTNMTASKTQAVFFIFSKICILIYLSPPNFCLS
jgi:hypothetical protein